MDVVRHNESQETKDFIADWIAPNFFYSKKDVWHRFGMLGVFGDYVLSCTPGNIGEIGVGESSIYLTHLARKWGRQSFHCDVAPGKIVNPLTIDGYLTPEGLNIDMKEGAKFHNAHGNHFYVGPSDKFFQEVPMGQLALSFVDGDHIYEQAKKDFDNFAARTADNGYIMLHDTHPPSDDYLREERCGSVWKLRQDIEKDLRYDCITLPVGCAISVGLTIVRKRPAEAKYYHE